MSTSVSVQVKEQIRKADKECEGVYRIVDYDKKIYEKISTSTLDGSSSNSGSGSDGSGSTGGSTGGDDDLGG